jgi:type I restriction enzyme S subunit
MRAWREVSLGEGLKVRHGYAFKGEHFKDHGDLIVLTPGNFIDGGGFKSKSGVEKYYDGLVPPGYLLSKGDVVVAMTEQAHGLLGSSATIPSDDRYLHNQRIGLLEIVNPEILDLRFVYHLMNSPDVRRQVQATATGTKVRHTAPERIRAVHTTLPPLDVQRTIAAVLDSLDDLIENNRRRVEVLEEMARAIYREWFVHFRYPGHETAAIMDSTRGRIPKGWALRRSGDLASEGVLDIGDGYRAKNSEMTGTDQGLPFVRVGNIRDGRLSVAGCDRLPDEYRARLRSKVSRPGDVVISMKGTVGRHALVHEWDPEMAYSPQVSFWRSLAPEMFSPVYLYLWIQSDNFVEQCAAVKGATDMADYVNLTDQRRMLVAEPPRELMATFTELVQPTLLAAGTLRAQKSRLASLRALLLPKLVTGQIDVSSLDLDAQAQDSVA